MPSLIQYPGPVVQTQYDQIVLAEIRISAKEVFANLVYSFGGEPQWHRPLHLPPEALADFEAQFSTLPGSGLAEKALAYFVQEGHLPAGGAVVTV